MLMYPDHIQNWLDFGYNLSVFSILAQHNLVKLVKFEVSDDFINKVLVEWPAIWHADVSWPPSELNKFWSQSVLLKHQAISIHSAD